MRRRCYLHRSHFVLRATRGPVAVLCRYDVGASFGIVECCVDDTRLYARGDRCLQRNVAFAASKRYEFTILDAASLRIMRMDFQQIFAVPNHIRCAACLGPHVVLRQDPARRQQQRELAVGALLGGDVVGFYKEAPATHEVIDVHDRCSHRCSFIAGPLHAANFIEKLEAYVVKCWCQLRDLIHDLGGIVVVHRVTEGLGQFLGDAPLGFALARFHDRAYTIYAAFCVDKRAVFFQERCAWQEDVRELRGLIEE